MKNWKLCLAIAASSLIGCMESQDVSTPTGTAQSKESDGGDPYLGVLLKMGYHTNDIVKEGEEYVVQGDMRYGKASLDALRNGNALGKTSQNRATQYLGTEVKNLYGVAQIYVYLGSTIGPNWAAAARQAMANWNAITGTAVYFIETTNVNIAQIAIGKCVCSAPPYWPAMTSMRTDSWVVSIIYLDMAKESDAVLSRASKTYAFSHQLGHALNIGHTDQTTEGTDYISGSGTWVNTNIAGTPTSDANSMFNSAFGTAKSFSTNDIAAIRYMYPSGPVLVRLLNGDLWTEGQTPLLQGPVAQFQQDGDRILALMANGMLKGKDGVQGSWLDLMPGVTAFRMSGDRIGCLTSDKRFFTKTGLSGSWTQQTTNAVKIDIDGTVFAAIKTDGSLWGTPNGSPASWVNLFTGPLSDFQLEGSRIGVLSNGNLFLKDGFSAIWGPIKRSGVQSFQLDGNRVATLESGTLFATDGINGTWYIEMGGVSKYQISGTRIGALVGSTLWVKEGLSGLWVNETTDIWEFRLQKYYITVIRNADNRVLAKYDLSNAWFYYDLYALALAQR